MARFVFCLGILLASAPVSADWVIFTNGSRTRVESVAIEERAVHIITLAGKRWSVLRDTVDVDATRAANAPPVPLEVITVEDAPAIPEPAVEAPMVEAPTPPPITVVESEPAPAAPASDIVDIPSASRGAHRVAVTLNGVRGTDAVTFTDSNQFELFKETASIDSVYRDTRREGYELGVQYRFAGPFAVGATAQLFDGERDASYTAMLPHPFFFERFRELSGDASGLTREELAIHLDAVVTKTWGPLTVDAFAGPSWFRTRTEVLVDVSFEEVFPYDEVFLRGVEGRVIESEPFGYNVGASVTFRIASIVGVDFGARYSEARSSLTVDDGREIELDVGGLNVSAGLRFLFP